MLRSVLLMLLCTLMACESQALTGVAPCLAHDQSIRTAPIGPPAMELLLVVDNTHGMEAAQTAFAAQMPRLVETLRSGLQPDGRQLPRPSEVRIGVITSDLGAAGFETSTCALGGDDGVFQLDPACATEELPFLALRSDVEVSEDLGAQLRCAVDVGTGGCEFPQPLEALLKAVTPASSELSFALGRGGHAELNGFIQGSSLAGVIFLTSGDDCSASDTGFFDPEGPHADVPLRCQAEGVLHPLERIIDGLAAVQYLDSIVFGVIAGVPPDLVTDPIAPDYDALIGPERDPRMRVEASPTAATEPRASCGVLGNVDSDGATPPVRLVEFLQAVEEADAPVVLGSICAPDFGSFVDAFAEELGLLNRFCLPRALERDLNGRARCDVVEVQPAESEMRCADRRSDGRVLLHVDDDEREVCLVCQSDEEGAIIDAHPECQALATEEVTSVGWFYQEGESVRGCAPGQRHVIEFFDASHWTPNAVLRLECPLRDDEVPALGGRCSASRPCETQLEGLASVCEVASGTCQAPCEHNADCAPAGPTYQCVNYGDDGRRYCLNSMCQ